MNLKIRKRAIISFVITLVCLILSFKWYFCYKTIAVTFEAKSKSDIKGRVEVQINKRFDDDFFSNKSAFADTEISQYFNKITLNVKRVKKAKKVRFIFSGFPKKQNFRIKDFTLGEKYKLEDLNKFSADGAALNIKKDTLEVSPQNDSFTITYEDELQLKTPLSFEWEIFVIIAVLSWLLVYKLTDYIADFKSIGNKSRADIIFLLAFFTCLFIPMAKINQETFSQQENRSLAEWKPLIASAHELNYSFGKDFESYFSDRFNMRKYIISFYKNMKIGMSFKLSENNNIWYNKKTGWAFMKSWISEPDIKPELPKYMKSIDKLYDFCKKNNIKLYIVIAPVKEEIYSQEIEPLNVLYQNGKTLEQAINKKYKNIAYFPFDELKQASKTEFVYPKTDPHWTEAGGYLACNDFLKRYGFIPFSDNDYNITERALPVITDIPDWIEDNYSGYYYKTLGIENKDNYKHLEHKYESELKHITKQPDIRLYSKDTIFPRAKNPQKVFIIGDSYVENYYRFLRFAFKNVIKRRVNNALRDDPRFSLWEEEIVEEKPDMLIIVFNSFGAKRFPEMWKK